MKKCISTAITTSLIAGITVVPSAVYMCSVISDSKKLFCDNCDYLLILGGNVIGADTPSPQLLERMKRAAEYLRNHPHTVAVPCGGCFRKGQTKSEAGIIADYLISEGIEENRIIPEDKSTTTFENFEFGIPLIEKHNDGRIEHPRIAFLSSTYHIHRATKIARMCGLKNPGRVSASTPGEAYKRYIREYFVAYQLLQKKLEEFLK